MKKRWFVLAALAAAAGVVAFMPMRVAFDMAAGPGSSVSAQAVRGTIWDGEIDGAALGPVALGDLDAGLALGPLFTGRAAVDFTPRGGRAAGDGLSGALHRDLGGGMGLSGLSGRIDGSALDSALPVGDITLTGASVDFDAVGRCTSAGGEAAVTLGAAIAGLQLTRGLSGPLGCDGDRLRIALTGQSDMERADILLGPDRRYRAVIRVETGGDPIMGGALRLAGFRSETPGRFALVRTGAF
jgi:general secretion pathway protein N